MFIQCFLGGIYIKNRKYRKLFSIFIILLTLSSCIWPTVELNNNKPNDRLLVYFIDVGQGDCIFTQIPGGKTMLIDAGSNGYSQMIIEYISSLGVGKIDYIIGTHPHEDHIGSLAEIISYFDIGEIYMPKAATNTNAFERLLTAAEDGGYKINTAAAGTSFLNAKAVNAEFLAPKSDYDDLNNYSAVVKLEYGSVSFLFTGDAQTASEIEMLEKPEKLKSDVLKVGHHGSNSSTSTDFFNAVSPSYAVISCGANNQYGHPHEQTLELLKDVKLYRTDMDGTIVFITDGKSISVKTQSK